MEQEEISDGAGDVTESRREPRFEVLNMLEAQFAGRAAVVRNLSIRGIRLRHREQLKVSSAVDVKIDAPENDTAMQFHCRVAWSRLSRIADERGRPFYESGLFILDDSPAAARMMDRLIHAYGEIDPDSLDAKRRRLEARAKERASLPAAAASDPVSRTGVTHDDAQRIHEALEILAADPETASSWHDRAKQSLVALGLLSSATDTPAHHRDVLVIWEYMGRTLDLDTVSTIAGFGRNT